MQGTRGDAVESHEQETPVLESIPGCHLAACFRRKSCILLNKKTFRSEAVDRETA